MRKLALLLILVIATISIVAQPTFVQRASTNFGNLQSFSGGHTTDGGFIISARISANVTIISKLDDTGVQQWDKLYGVSGRHIDQNAANGYIFVGNKVLKLNASGNSQWARSYQGTFNFASQTSDLGYIMTGTTSSYGAGGSDLYVVKIASNGSLMWHLPGELQVTTEVETL